MVKGVMRFLFPQRGHPVVVHVGDVDNVCEALLGMQDVFDIFSVEFVSVARWPQSTDSCNWSELLRLFGQSGLRPYTPRAAETPAVKLPVGGWREWGGKAVEWEAKRDGGPVDCADESTLGAETYLNHPVGTSTGDGSVSVKMQLWEGEQDLISQRILQNGCWEKDEVGLLIREIRRHPTAIFIDIGSNIGVMSAAVKAALPDTPVIAFEPHYGNMVHQCRTMTLPENNFNLSNYFLFPYGASRKTDFSGSQVVFTDYGNKGDSYIPDDSHKELPRFYSSKIKSLRVDDILGSFVQKHWPPNHHPVVLKIDIEGYECEAIRGMEGLFASYDVKFVLIEWGKLKKRCEDVPRLIKTLSASGLWPYSMSGILLLKMFWRWWPWNVQWR
eukprot:GHVU01066225.1.p2 GENE.GHVU01066225.1~~GHVU01066225.1.p2  ORF type:complete len:386 (-),score=34.55 GHVU01066225.1:1225-2382(-)